VADTTAPPMIPDQEPGHLYLFSALPCGDVNVTFASHDPGAPLAVTAHVTLTRDELRAFITDAHNHLARTREHDDQRPADEVAAATAARRARLAALARPDQG
jgi:hypothetical protein